MNVYLVYENLAYSGESPVLLGIYISYERALKEAMEYMKTIAPLRVERWIKKSDFRWERGDEHVFIEEKEVLA